MRMGMRRFTRLMNGFSKKIENLKYAVALHFMHYNFCRVHQTLRVTPAMEAGVADHVWDISEIVALLDDQRKNGSLAQTIHGKKLMRSSCNLGIELTARIHFNPNECNSSSSLF
jgi:hypothetical protein